MKTPSGVREPTGGPTTSEVADHTPESSQLFGRYRLLGRIGEGGMAEVFRAVITGPEGFEKELVLKRILPRLSGAGDFKTMFIREAKISALLLHPNVVQIYDFGEADGAYFIAMESVQGVTLREVLTRLRKAERTLPHLIAADIARQIGLGLDYAHTLKGPDGLPLEIVHQDISPTNLMLAWNGTVKILDFGIARAASFADEEREKGLIKGKVSYLSPEQIHARPFDARADVFALGVVFHEMLTGRKLFQARNDIARMRQLLAQPIAPPSAIDATIPRELDRIVMRALEIEPAARYRTAAEMAADIERTLIAARHSSRELSRLLGELYGQGEASAPVPSLEDVGEARTPVVRTVTDTTTGRLTPSPDRSGPSRLPPSTSGRRHDPDASRLEGAHEAEKVRLRRTRWRGYAKVTVLLLGVAALGGAVSVAVKRLVPIVREVMRPPPPPPPPPATAHEPPPPELGPPPPPPKPPRKHTRKTKSRATDAPDSEPPAAPPTGEPPQHTAE